MHPDHTIHDQEHDAVSTLVEERLMPQYAARSIDNLVVSSTGNKIPRIAIVNDGIKVTTHAYHANTGATIPVTTFLEDDFKANGFEVINAEKNNKN